MIYAATITTDEGTAKADAKKTVLRLTKGLVWKIEAEFPPGCAGLAHLQVFDGLYQVFPSTPGESFHSDGVLIGFDDLYFKTSEPFEFTIKTWNLDTVWPHTLQLRIGMASSDAFISRYLPAAAWENYEKLRQQVYIDQEIERQSQLDNLSTELKDFTNGTG